jgi:chemotaxis protein methyltransferase CheR
VTRTHPNEAPALPPLDYELFRRLIRDAFGLEYPPHKRDLLRRRLERRLRHHGLRRWSEYYRLLCYEPRGGREWALFAEAITNNETYFFRDARQFALLARTLPSIAARRSPPIRALSAGCASGEEAYSLAMTLASRLGPSATFEVRGIDLSEARLADATAARYPPRSFRREDPAPPDVRLEDYLTIDEDGACVVRPSLRERVAFERGNLADAEGLRRLGTFDVVFCRNVLIYAEEGALERFVASLGALVREQGYLFLGHAEALPGAGAPFALTRVEDRFAYVRRGGERSSPA